MNRKIVKTLLLLTICAFLFSACSAPAKENKQAESKSEKAETITSESVSATSSEDSLSESETTSEKAVTKSSEIDALIEKNADYYSECIENFVRNDLGYKEDEMIVLSSYFADFNNDGRVNAIVIGQSLNVNILNQIFYFEFPGGKTENMIEDYTLINACAIEDKRIDEVKIIDTGLVSLVGIDEPCLCVNFSYNISDNSNGFALYSLSTGEIVPLYTAVGQFNMFNPWLSYHAWLVDEDNDGIVDGFKESKYVDYSETAPTLMFDAKFSFDFKGDTVAKTTEASVDFGTMDLKPTAIVKQYIMLELLLENPDFCTLSNGENVDADWQSLIGARMAALCPNSLPDFVDHDFVLGTITYAMEELEIEEHIGMGSETAAVLIGYWWEDKYINLQYNLEKNPLENMADQWIITDLMDASSTAVAGGDTDELYHALFLNSINVQNRYSLKTITNEVVETEVLLNNEVIHHDNDEIVVHTYSPDGIPALYGWDADRQIDWYFLETESAVFLMDYDQFNEYMRTGVTTENMAIIVFEPYPDAMAGKKGHHEWIDHDENGNTVYHSYNDSVDTGFYQSFTWKPGIKCAYAYRSGFGAEKDAIEMQRIE